MYIKGGEVMAISLRLNEKEADLFRRYADIKGLSLSEMVRQAVLNQIEDEIDLQAYEKAYAAYLENPVTHTLSEVEKELGLL